MDYTVTALSDADLAALKRLLGGVSRRRGGKAGPWGPGGVDDSDPPAPEVYLARAPGTDDGIPAAVETSGSPVDLVPGVADCAVYQLLDDGTPVPAGPDTVAVYNLGPKVTGGDYCVVARDKFGKWLVTGVPVPTSGTVHGVLDGDLTATGTATLSVYSGRSTDTGADLAVQSVVLRSGDVVYAGTMVHAARDATDGLWYVFAAVCDPDAGGSGT